MFFACLWGFLFFRGFRPFWASLCAFCHPLRSLRVQLLHCPLGRHLLQRMCGPSSERHAAGFFLSLHPELLWIGCVPLRRIWGRRGVKCWGRFYRIALLPCGWVHFPGLQRLRRQWVGSGFRWQFFLRFPDCRDLGAGFHVFLGFRHKFWTLELNPTHYPGLQWCMVTGHFPTGRHGQRWGKALVGTPREWSLDSEVGMFFFSF